MHEISIYVKNYKCFTRQTGFQQIKLINVLIGRNNIGKSSLLDIISMVCNNNYEFEDADKNMSGEPMVIFRTIITEEVITKSFSANTSGGTIRGNHLAYGQKLINKSIEFSKYKDTRQRGNVQINLIKCNDEDLEQPLNSIGKSAEPLLRNLPNPLGGKLYKLIAAERNIIPENHHIKLSIDPNGTGITNVIQNYLTRSDLNSSLVENKLLDSLNMIMSPDSLFSNIYCQRHSGSNLWEIFLEEEQKGRIALSKSGSGLKTVISILVNLYLLPEIEKTALSNCVFAIEEPENNLHPALLRRLTYFIYRLAVEHKFLIFIATHSNVLIDQFSKQKDAQIIHVSRNNGETVSATAKTYVDNNGILDDLDVRASDLLQANGIIWVEGPSDRIYLNHWIQLWSNGLIKEGTHYQVLYYGGRLLAHLSAEDPNLVVDYIAILNANRNALIIMDSDKRNRQSRINETKRRIEKEFKALNSLCWITKGREIENYIASKCVDEFFDLKGTSQVDQFTKFYNHLETCGVENGIGWATKKPQLAEHLIPFMTKENMKGILDIDKQMNEICLTIKRWNSMTSD